MAVLLIMSKMKNIYIIIILCALILISAAPLLNAETNSSPYGDSKGKGYGEMKTVNTIDEAKKILSGFFSGREVKIGIIVEKELFFESEILDKHNNIIDKVIIDKRTGRIRSIY
jgi:hypothetical protein